MSDIHDENKIKTEEEELKTLDDSSNQLEQLRQELKQRKIAMEEMQTRISTLDHTISLSADATAVSNLQQELNLAKQELDLARHREACGDDRETYQRGQIAELHSMLSRAKRDVGAANKALAAEKKKNESLESSQADLIRKNYRLTVDLGVAEALLEKKT
ncbi:hypothetical protein KCU78_g2782, partial [Aureobasidium melanogenum]